MSKREQVYTELIPFKVDKDMREKLEKRAKAEKKSVSEIIRTALKLHLF